MQAAAALESVRVAATAFLDMPGALAAGASGAAAATDLLDAPNSGCMKEFLGSAAIVLGDNGGVSNSICLVRMLPVSRGTLAALVSAHFVIPKFVIVDPIHCIIPSCTRAFSP